MNNGIITQHDILLLDYRRKINKIKEAKENNDIEKERLISFYIDGLSYAFSQIFGYNPDQAEFITQEYKDAYPSTNETGIPSIRIHDVREIAKSIRSELAGKGRVDDPTGSAYYILKEYDIDDDVTLNLIVNVCKYRDVTDKHLYYGIYNVIEIDGGPNICEPDWEYTDNCDITSLINALKKILADCSSNMMKVTYESYDKNVDEFIIGKKEALEIAKEATDIEVKRDYCSTTSHLVYARGMKSFQLYINKWKDGHYEIMSDAGSCKLPKANPDVHELADTILDTAQKIKAAY